MVGCNKQRYASKVSALLALLKIERAADPTHRERRTYRCPECGGWHLTSKHGGGASGRVR